MPELQQLLQVICSNHPQDTWIPFQGRKCNQYYNTSDDRELITLWESIYHGWTVLSQSPYLEGAEIYRPAYSPCRSLISPPLKWEDPIGFRFQRISLSSSGELSHRTPELSLLPVGHLLFLPSLLTWPGFKSLQQLDLSSLDGLPFSFIALKAKCGSHW